MFVFDASERFHRISRTPLRPYFLKDIIVEGIELLGKPFDTDVTTDCRAIQGSLFTRCHVYCLRNFISVQIIAVDRYHD